MEGNGNHVVGKEPQPMDQGIFDLGSVVGAPEDVPHVTEHAPVLPELTVSIGIGAVSVELTVPAGSKVRLHPPAPRAPGTEPAPARPLHWNRYWGPVDPHVEEIVADADGGIFKEGGRFKMPRTEPAEQPYAPLSHSNVYWQLVSVVCRHAEALAEEAIPPDEWLAAHPDLREQLAVVPLAQYEDFQLAGVRANDWLRKLLAVAADHRGG